MLNPVQALYGEPREYVHKACKHRDSHTECERIKLEKVQVTQLNHYIARHSHLTNG